MITRVAICCVVISAGLGLSAQGQVRKFAFQQLTEEQGLSQNFVYGLTEDATGFLWISTGLGLSRYDGSELKRYTHHDSLSADFITADLCARSGNLIFGHNNGGLTLFDGTQFKKLLPDTLGNKVVSIAEGNSDFFWVATQSNGLIYLDHRNNKITRVYPTELQGQSINVIFATDEILWVGTDEGLRLFKMAGNSLAFIENEVLPPYISVHAIKQHSSNPALVWLGTAFNGIFLVERIPGSTAFAVVTKFVVPEFSNDVAQAIAQDADGDLWIGTRQNGVLHLNLSRSGHTVLKTTYFRRRTGFPFISVNRLVTDRQGQIWVGTMGDGVFKIYRELFTYFHFGAFGVTNVRSIAELPSGYLVGTDAGLLKILLNPQSDEYEVQPVAILKGEPVLALFTDSRNNTWIGTETKGVFIFSDHNERLERIQIDLVNEPVAATAFEEDNLGNIWLSARANGVYELDKMKVVTRHLTTKNRFIHNDVFSIKADSKGNVWFGTYGAGLAMLKKDGELQLFSKQDSLKARDINDIDEDNEGNIWIATEGDGFFRYKDGVFTQIGSYENLISPYIKGIQFDPSGRVWFSYRKALGFFDLQSEKKHHFTIQDGLFPGEAYSSIIVDSKANKWFCNDFGVTLFEYDTISNDRKALETYVAGVRIFFKDHPVGPGEGRPGDVRLPTLSLSHEENHVTFDFVAIKLNRTGSIYYRHFLEGYDSEWTPPETANFVTYTNLDPGKYVFKVQATDDLGSWVDPVTSYSFEISPPYWKRTWFYLLQLMSVVTLFTLTYLIGKKGGVTKRYVVRLMLFSSFFITLEYVENFIDPLVSGFFDGAPVFRFFMNFLLALLLLPVETLISRWLMERQLKSQEVDGKGVTIEEEVLLEEDRLTSPRE